MNLQARLIPPHEPISSPDGPQWSPSASPKLTPTTTEQLKMTPPVHLVTSEVAKTDEPKAEEAISKIAIIGTAPSSRMLAPFNDPTWKIWSCSPGNMNILPRVDMWFEIHNNLLWPEHQSYGVPYVEWLKKQTFPVYMQDQSMIPTALSLPKDELIKEFGPYFFTSSFAWMIAFALWKHKASLTDIGLFGIDMASKDEYILQRPGGHYFMAEASRRGIRVHLPLESDLMQPPGLYGYSSSTPFGRKLAVRKHELKTRVDEMVKQRDALTNNITYLQGALEDLDYTEAIWIGVGDR